MRQSSWLTEGWRSLPRGATLVAAILLLLGLGVIAQAEQNYREQKASETHVQAAVLAANITAALDFGDATAAQEAVRALRLNPQIIGAGIYDAEGNLFAGYWRSARPLPARLPATRPEDANVVQDSVPIMRGASRIGTVLLTTDVEPLARRLTRYVLIGLLGVMASLIVVVLGVANAATHRVNLRLEQANAELRFQIEERTRAEGQLRQAQKMESIGQLTGGIAHDFNNMLAVIIGSLDMARRRFDTSPHKALVSLDHASEAANRAAGLTSRLLAFARQQALEPQPLEVNQLVSGMSDLLRRTIGEQIRVETVLSGGAWRAYADPGQLESAIVNLCVNARDAMPDGGNLTVETLNTALDDEYASRHDDVIAGQYVAIAVSDTGTGMPAEVIERAFDPFFTTKGVGKGTGLGLSQVYGFAKQSGGHVAIYSEPGQGTTVRIYLPRYQGELLEGEAGGSLTEAPPRGEPGEILLIVEDEAPVRQMSADALEDLGYTVFQAASAAEALSLLDLHPEIRMVFTDVVMPDMNGRQLVDLIHERRPDAKVLFTTGYTRNAVVHNGMLDPGVAFLAKPFTVEQLARKVRAVFDGGGINRTEPTAS
jgi:signal transduction histidine kinase/CheY-like chemotaxis protein